jgi:transposase
LEFVGTSTGGGGNEVTKVELFELIRHEHILHGKSIRHLSQDLGIHRRMVRQALCSAIPPPRKRPVREPTVLTSRLRGIIDSWLFADREAPRKQRHTARRIHRRLQEEHAYPGSELTVSRYVRRRRREIGDVGEAFVLQIHAPGEEAEVDWYEASVDFPSGRENVQFFQMRSCFSGDEFHMAFPRPTQQAFFEGHVGAFSSFGGVFRTIRYDNLSSAVKKILSGRRREESDRFVTLRSHYLFTASFCRPGREGAHEKGGVEGAVGRFRRNHLVPVPRVADFDELNGYLLSRAVADRKRRIAGKADTVEEDRQKEAAHLRALPATPFPTAEVAGGRVDAKGLVHVKTNRYSVPIRLAGRTVEVRRHARRVELLCNGRVVARHERLLGRFGIRVSLDHYLELLMIKPGAFQGSLVLHQARAAGAFPPLYDRLLERLNERYGQTEGTRHLIEVLMLLRQAPREEVHASVEQALSLGLADAYAIAVILRHRRMGEEVAPGPLADLGALAVYERPAGDVRHYDALLAGVVSTEVH